jgi:hypothetical protein
VEIAKLLAANLSAQQRRFERFPRRGPTINGGMMPFIKNTSATMVLTISSPASLSSISIPLSSISVNSQSLAHY